MSEWKIQQLTVDLHSKKATLLAVQQPRGVHVMVNNLNYDQPGQQTEAELQKMALKAAKLALQDLLDNPPTG